MTEEQAEQLANAIDGFIVAVMEREEKRRVDGFISCVNEVDFYHEKKDFIRALTTLPLDGERREG